MTKTLKILKYPHEHLRYKAQAIDSGWAEALAFARQMEAAMNDAEGIGLAATQVGDSRRIIVLKASDEAQPAFMLANPVITESSTELNTHEEGCLSLPEVTAPVKRPAIVTVKAYDLNANAETEIEATELLATCLQHEIDHLNGVLFIDHLSRLRRSRLLAKYKKANEQQAKERS